MPVCYGVTSFLEAWLGCQGSALTNQQGGCPGLGCGPSDRQNDDPAMWKLACDETQSSLCL